MSDDDERDPHGEPVLPQDPLGSFDAFRARRAQERAQNEPFPEPFPEQYESEPTAVLPPEAGGAPSRFGGEQGSYSAVYPGVPGFDYAGTAPGGRDAARGRGRLRSVLVLGAVVLVVITGLVVGVYAATRSPSGQFAAASPPTPSASASASVGASQAPKYGKAVTARLTITAVGADSFSATAADGANVSVQITSATKFGTAARPFARSQLVPGAVVYARLRRASDGTVVATVIAAPSVGQGDPAATASAEA